ncbi:MAG: hypothetical protein AAB356_02125, partial [Deltaproteobacteria bacterium]
ANNGVNTILIKVVDALGTIQSEKKVVFDNVPPAMNITGFPESDTTRNSTITLKGVASEPVTFIINNETFLSLPGGLTFEKTIQLQQGKTIITVVARDVGGNDVTVERVLFFDSLPLSFTSTTLDKFSTVYNQEVTVTGALNKKASVSVMVDGKREKTISTDDAGKFSVNVPLTGKLKVDTTKSPTGASATLDLKSGFKTKVQLFAVDASGYSDQTPVKEITRTVCGGGQVILKRSNILPNNLIPDLLLRGIHKVTQTVEIEPLPNTVIKSVQFYKPQGLSDVASDEFDQDWFTVGQSVRKPDKKLAVVTLNIQAPDTLDPDAKTRADKEMAVSKHNDGECKTTPGGCFKGLVFMKVLYQESTNIQSDDPALSSKQP